MLMQNVFTTHRPHEVHQMHSIKSRTSFPLQLHPSVPVSQPLTKSGDCTYQLLQQKRFMFKSPVSWYITSCGLVYWYHFVSWAPWVGVLSYTNVSQPSIRDLSSFYPRHHNDPSFRFNPHTHSFLSSMQHCFYNRFYTHLTDSYTI
jgi:hypothetical protein